MTDPKHPLCIYHGNCADGFTAAWVVWRYFNKHHAGAVDFWPGIYGEDPPDCSDRDVILVDFSYKRPVLDEMFRRVNSMLILDHHKTAQADLADYLAPYGGAGWKRHLDNVYQDTCEGCPQPYALFDMDRSGAQVAWDFFFGGARPKLVDYVGDRDLWRFEMIFSREINAYIFAYAYDFKEWDMLAALLTSPESVVGVAERGKAIEKKHHKDVRELVDKFRRTMKIGGRDMPVANIPYTLTSDAGHLMAREDRGVAACYWDTPQGRVFSLRSTESGPDVSEIAKLYGGGGHAKAAGFQRPLGWEGDE